MAKNKNHPPKLPVTHGHDRAPAPAAPPAEEPKGLFAQAAAAIDHIIHPDAQPSSEPEKVEGADAPVSDVVPAKEEKPAESYHEHMAKWPSKKERGEKPAKKKGVKCPTEESDFEQHPKFSKFKKGEN